MISANMTSDSFQRFKKCRDWLALLVASGENDWFNTHLFPNQSPQCSLSHRVVRLG